MNRIKWPAPLLGLSALVGVSFGSASVRSTELVVAQAGSYGGSIGKQDKSVSGAEEQPRRARSRAYREPAEPRRQIRNSFDGTWSVQAFGQNCSNNSVAAVVVSGGHVVGQGVTGTVSPSGAVRTVGAAGAVSITSHGQLRGASGSGVYRQSDGCIGRWIAARQ